MTHETVLLHETVNSLNLKPKAIVFDGTLGGGGHSAEIALQFGPQVKIIATDRDREAIERAKIRLDKMAADFTPVLSDFREIDKVLADLKIKQIDGVIFDLGLSSNQIDDSDRGFTFKKDEPLLMTMASPKDRPLVTAHTVVNNWSEETLADIIYAYGDERYARRIAKAIVTARENHIIKTTGELVEIISSAVPGFYRMGKIHFATKTFQAIRIAVNDELGALQVGLEKAFNLLKTGGRMAVISFHSGEDRIVKNFFRDQAKNNKAVLVNKKPIIPTDEEISKNPRSRSAKLRVIEKK